MESETISRLVALLATNPPLRYSSPDKQWQKFLNRQVPGWQPAVASLSDAAPLLAIDYKLKGCAPEVPFFQFIHAILPHLSDRVLQQLLVTVRAERGWDYYLIVKGWQETHVGDMKSDLATLITVCIGLAIPTFMGIIPPGWAALLFGFLALATVLVWLSRKEAKKSMGEHDLLLQRLEGLGLHKVT